MILLGAAAGAMGGLLGIGGGALIVPGLVFLLGFDQHLAHGTSLAVVLVSSAVAVATYGFHDHIDLRLAVGIAVGGVIGAMIGARVANAIKGTILRRTFCLFLVFLGVRMILCACAKDSASSTAIAALLDAPLRAAAILLSTGIAAGFVSSLLGIGGGVVMVPAMTLLLCIPQQLAQGVSLTAILATASTGALVYHSHGRVEMRVAAWVGLGGVVGALAGSLAAANLDTATLKLVFGAFLIVMSTLLALRKDRRSQAEVLPGSE